jgi:hypothetical protein
MRWEPDRCHAKVSKVTNHSQSCIILAKKAGQILENRAILCIGMYLLIVLLPVQLLESKGMFQGDLPSS